MSETNQQIYVANDKGAVELVTSLFLYVQRPDSDTFEEIGIATKGEVSEERPMTYNYVIGNGGSGAGASTATPRDLIPGVISRSTIRLDMLALYKKNVLAALGSIDGANWMSSIRYQTRPFLIKERTVHPNTSKIREIWYEGCMISDYTKNMDISGTDIRIMENVTVHYKIVSTKVDQINADV